MSPDQIEQERQMIQNAPQVPTGDPADRCHLCGKISKELHPLETLGQITRYVGDCCYKGGPGVIRSTSR